MSNDLDVDAEYRNLDKFLDAYRGGIKMHAYDTTRVLAFLVDRVRILEERLARMELSAYEK